MSEITDLGATFNEFQTVRNSSVRIAVLMSSVPIAIPVFMGPISDEPELRGVIAWLHDIHTHETRDVIDEVRSSEERLTYFILHLIGDGKAAHGYESDRARR